MGKAENMHFRPARFAERPPALVLAVETPTHCSPWRIKRVFASDLVVNRKSRVGESPAQAHPQGFSVRPRMHSRGGGVLGLHRAVVFFADDGDVFLHDAVENIGELPAPTDCRCPYLYMGLECQSRA